MYRLFAPAILAGTLFLRSFALATTTAADSTTTVSPMGPVVVQVAADGVLVSAEPGEKSVKMGTEASDSSEQLTLTFAGMGHGPVSKSQETGAAIKLKHSKNSVLSSTHRGTHKKSTTRKAPDTFIRSTTSTTAVEATKTSEKVREARDDVEIEAREPKKTHAPTLNDFGPYSIVNVAHVGHGHASVHHKVKHTQRAVHLQKHATHAHTHASSVTLNDFGTATLVNVMKLGHGIVMHTTATASSHHSKASASATGAHMKEKVDVNEDEEKTATKSTDYSQLEGVVKRDDVDDILPRAVSSTQSSSTTASSTSAASTSSTDPFIDAAGKHMGPGPIILTTLSPGSPAASAISAIQAAAASSSTAIVEGLVASTSLTTASATSSSSSSKTQKTKSTTRRHRTRPSSRTHHARDEDIAEREADFEEDPEYESGVEEGAADLEPRATGTHSKHHTKSHTKHTKSHTRSHHHTKSHSKSHTKSHSKLQTHIAQATVAPTASDSEKFNPGGMAMGHGPVVLGTVAESTPTYHVEHVKATTSSTKGQVAHAKATTSAVHNVEHVKATAAATTSKNLADLLGDGSPVAKERRGGLFVEASEMPSRFPMLKDIKLDIGLLEDDLFPSIGSNMQSLQPRLSMHTKCSNQLYNFIHFDWTPCFKMEWADFADEDVLQVIGDAKIGRNEEYSAPAARDALVKFIQNICGRYRSDALIRWIGIFQSEFVDTEANRANILAVNAREVILDKNNCLMTWNRWALNPFPCNRVAAGQWKFWHKHNHDG